MQIRDVYSVRGPLERLWKRPKSIVRVEQIPRPWSRRQFVSPQAYRLVEEPEASELIASRNLRGVQLPQDYVVLQNPQTNNLIFPCRAWFRSQFVRQEDRKPTLYLETIEAVRIPSGVSINTNTYSATGEKAGLSRVQAPGYLLIESGGEVSYLPPERLDGLKELPRRFP